MEYHISIDVLAQQEIGQALLYYNTFRKRPAIQFIADLESAFDQIGKNPYKPLRYKDVRAIRLQEFPFALYYSVKPNEKQVNILSCFQDFRNPRRRKLKETESTVASGQKANDWPSTSLSTFTEHTHKERKGLNSKRRRLTKKGTLAV